MIELSNTNSKVSILIPTHNRERFILSAVSSALAQTHSNLEVLVGVNGCTDNTEQLVRGVEDKRLQVIVRPELKSMYENFNLLVKEATGEFVLILSDDDVLLPEAIEKLLYAIHATKARMALGAVKVIECGGGEILSNFDIFGECANWVTVIKSYFGFQLAIYPCSTLLPRRELLDIGGYDDGDYYFAADTAVWMRLAQRLGHVALVHDVVANYMIHDSNETIVSSQERWLSALGGIGKVIELLEFSSDIQREQVKIAFELYRARTIVRTQSDAVGRAGGRMRSFIASARIVVRESSKLSLAQRMHLIMRWLARSAIQSVRSR